jgi:hypothetical protein
MRKTVQEMRNKG